MGNCFRWFVLRRREVALEPTDPYFQVITDDAAAARMGIDALLMSVNANRAQTAIATHTIQDLMAHVNIIGHTVAQRTLAAQAHSTPRQREILERIQQSAPDSDIVTVNELNETSSVMVTNMQRRIKDTNIMHTLASGGQPAAPNDVHAMLSTYLGTPERPHDSMSTTDYLLQPTRGPAEFTSEERQFLDAITQPRPSTNAAAMILPDVPTTETDGLLSTHDAVVEMV